MFVLSFTVLLYNRNPNPQNGLNNCNLLFFLFILNHSEAKLLILEDASQWKIFLEIRSLIKQPIKVILMQKMGEEMQAALSTLAADYASGKITEEQYEERHTALLAKLEDLKKTVSRYMEFVQSATAQ